MSIVRSMRFLALAAALSLAPTVVAHAEDLTIVSKVTPSRGKATVSTQYLSEDKVRVTDGVSESIVDLGSGALTFVDLKKKSYWETTLEEMRAQFAEMEQLIRDMPLSGRMFGKVTEVTVVKGEGSRTVAGYTCHPYTLTMGEKMQMELCAAPDLKVPAQYHDAHKSFYAAMGPVASRFQKLWDAMKEIDGVPLETRLTAKFVGVRADSHSVATEVRVGALDPSVFAVPQGFKKKKSPFEQKRR